MKQTDEHLNTNEENNHIEQNSMPEQPPTTSTSPENKLEELVENMEEEGVDEVEHMEEEGDCNNNNKQEAIHKGDICDSLEPSQLECSEGNELKKNKTPKKMIIEQEANQVTQFKEGVQKPTLLKPRGIWRLRFSDSN